MIRKRRGNSEGSIFKMKDGRWRAAVTTGWKLNSLRKKIPKRKVFTGATRHEVAEEMTKALRDRQQGIIIDPKKMTVGEYLRAWLASVKPDVSPATYVSYEGTVRLHLVPILGDVQLAKLTARDVQRLKQEKIEAVVACGPGVKKPVEGQTAPEPRRLSAVPSGTA